MPTDDDLIFVNGIDVETGSFLVDPMDFSTLASIIKGERIDPAKAQDFKSIAQSSCQALARAAGRRFADRRHKGGLGVGAAQGRGPGGAQGDGALT